MCFYSSSKEIIIKSSAILPANLGIRLAPFLAHFDHFRIGLEQCFEVDFYFGFFAPVNEVFCESAACKLEVVWLL